jgi:uncharacterized DUF497 family protein
MKRLPLVWDRWNTEHIKKHGLTVTEVEYAYRHRIGKSGSYDGRQMIFGVTAKGKPITIAVSYQKQHRPYPVSARCMSKTERRKYL